MRRVAFVCPGQGAQRVGMARDVHAEFPTVRQTLDEAGDALGEPLDRIVFEGPEDVLTLTENAQPALLAVSVAIGRVLRDHGIRPVIAAGHSLGEWSALVLAGALDFADAIRAVRQRGRFMQEAVAPGVGAMSALLGADLAAAEQLCRDASRGDGEIAVPANVNGAGQIVVAGHTAAVERLEALARERKVRAMRLKVSAPFHTPLMRPARDRMRAVLDSLAVRDPDPPVVSNVDGRPNASAGRVRDLLAEQITAAVRWEDCAHAVVAACDVVLEVGPGKVLTGLMRRMAPDRPCLATDDVAGVRAALAEAGA
ncbi:MAG TPA: ACP S-malonyltransferase [Candidatus Binatia bacterium]|nr:ACP S-malonyltransferase [Candidatus Binatia bacterium]